MSRLLEAAAKSPHWLYLIDSGNGDHCFKIGYTSRSLEERLAEIIEDYSVPDAKVVMQRQVLGKTAVLKLESELHYKYRHFHDSTYWGKEWHDLSDQQLEEIRQFYEDITA